MRRGRTPGIYRTWAECQKQVTGFAGAEYRKFPTETEARAYVAGEDPTKAPATGLHIYIDGSYDSKSKQFSYGLVGFFHGERFEEARAFSDPEAAVHRNVAGELYGAYRALQIALERKSPELDLYFDYAGIREWATGAWRAKNPLTRAYATTYNRFKTDVHVRFHKIAAHTGHPLNERADELAKQAFKEEKDAERV